MTPASQCGPGTLTLLANDTATVYWYDAASGGNLLGTGNTFTTPFLAASTTYYAIAGSLCPSAAIPVTAEILAVPVVNLGNDTVLTTGLSLALDAGAGFSSYLWNTTETTQAISDDVSEIDFVQVYPNPVHDVCSILLPAMKSDIQIRIFNAGGQLIHAEEIQSEQARISVIHVEDWARGIYFLDVLQKEKIQRVRIVVQ